MPEKRKNIYLNDILINAKSEKKLGYALLERYYNGNNYANKFDFHSQSILIKRSKKFKFTIVKETNFCHSYQNRYRLLNQLEMERLQGFPDYYTKILSASQASSILGDACTLPVIEMILKNLI